MDALNCAGRGLSCAGTARTLDVKWVVCVLPKNSNPATNWPLLNCSDWSASQQNSAHNTLCDTTLAHNSVEADSNTPAPTSQAKHYWLLPFRISKNVDDSDDWIPTRYNITWSRSTCPCSPFSMVASLVSATSNTGGSWSKLQVTSSGKQLTLSAHVLERVQALNFHDVRLLRSRS